MPWYVEWYVRVQCSAVKVPEERLKVFAKMMDPQCRIVTEEAWGGERNTLRDTDP